MSDAEQPAKHVAQLVLTFDPATFKMSISGTVGNLDMALCMLEQAMREIEHRQFEQRTPAPRIATVGPRLPDKWGPRQ